MNEVIRFALLGCGIGALYAFASQGLIVIFRGTGVLNFSLGATAIAGVFLQYVEGVGLCAPYMALNGNIARAARLGDQIIFSTAPYQMPHQLWRLPVQL